MTDEKKAGIKHTPLGKTFTGFCVVRKKSLKHKQDGAPYLILELGDHSGRLRAKIWNKAIAYYDMTHVGGIVKIQAVIQVFEETKELKILKMRPVEEKDGIQLHELLPNSGKDLTILKNKFEQHQKRIHHPQLRQLWEKLFNNPSLKNAYFASPSGKLWHHNYLAGTLEHAVFMLDVADTMVVHYPDIDLGLLKTGIVCHNIGKVQEYALDGFIDFSDNGRLIGYTAMSFDMVKNIIREMDNFSEELEKKLLHLILSHQSAYSKSGILSMTLEAVVLAHLILLDANTNALCRIKANDALPDSRWSKYIPLLDRFVYVGEQPNEPKTRTTD